MDTQATKCVLKCFLLEKDCSIRCEILVMIIWECNNTPRFLGLQQSLIVMGHHQVNCKHYLGKKSFTEMVFMY